MDHNYSFITPVELEGLKAQPHQIALKAQSKIDELSTTIETLKAERDAEVTNHDQLIHQIELQRGNLSQELEKLRKDNEVLRKDLDVISMLLFSILFFFLLLFSSPSLMYTSPPLFTTSHCTNSHLCRVYKRCICKRAAHTEKGTHRQGGPPPRYQPLC